MCPGTGGCQSLEVIILTAGTKRCQAGTCQGVGGHVAGNTPFLDIHLWSRVNSSPIRCYL